jgi:uncharacterized protein YjiS (DUF1127 family)
MNTQTFVAAGPLAIGPAGTRAISKDAGWRRHMRAFGRFVAGLVRAHAEARQRRATTYALQRLDAATLRDLGIDRSEAGSVAAELGMAEQATRRRTRELAAWYF